MPLDGEYVPSPEKWVRDQVELYESSGGTEGTSVDDLVRGLGTYSPSRGMRQF